MLGRNEAKVKVTMILASYCPNGSENALLFPWSTLRSCKMSCAV